MDQPHLTISLLGEFSLAVDGQAVSSFNGDRPITLLAYLLLNRHTPQSRQQLAFTLWPDSIESQARTNLRNLFYTLRQTLPAADSFLAADAMTLQWRLDSCYTLDVAEFEAALEAAKVAATPTDKIDSLETAVALYKGYLLPSNYDDWVIPVREELHQNYLDSLRQLLYLYEQQQEFRTAARVGQRLLQQDPLDETTYVQLMRLYALSGDRASVRRLYELCVATLKRELDIEPSSTTQAAYEQLLRLEISQAAVPLPAVETIPQPAISGSRTRPLPTPATRFIGREAELAHIAQLLAEPACRLLSIVGPGGMGKTRLALQTAVGHKTIFADGVTFVSLASLQDSRRLWAVMAEALGITPPTTADLQETVLAYLQSKEMLVILDNFEHLLAEVEILADILQATSAVKLLITSRQRLHLQEEWVLEIGGFELPEMADVEAIAANSAVALFVQSARRTNTHFEPTQQDYAAIFEICRLVDGMPLGIELAASWVRLLLCTEIALEIKQDLDFLQAPHHNVPDRHRNLRAVFEHSWQLLSPEEQQVLRSLSVFRGSFGRDAAEQIAGATLSDLSALADNSLLRPVQPNRYSLHELIRQYAAEKLVEAGQQTPIYTAYLNFFIQLVETAEDELETSPHSQWPVRLQAERENFWAGMNWAAAGGNLELGVRLAVALTRFWRTQGQNTAASDWLEAQLLKREALSSRTVGRALTTLGVLAFYRADFQQALPWLEEGGALARMVQDEECYLEALVRLGMVQQELNQFQAAHEAYSKALDHHRRRDDEFGVSRCLINLGTLAYDWQKEAEATTYFEEALALARRRNDPDTIATALTNLGWIAALQEDFALALVYGREAFNLFVQLRNYLGIAFVLESLGAAVSPDNAQGAAALLGAAAHLRQQYEIPLSGANALYQQRFVNIVQQKLDAQQFAEAWLRGEQMSFEEMIAATQAVLGEEI